MRGFIVDRKSKCIPRSSVKWIVTIDRHIKGNERATFFWIAIWQNLIEASNCQYCRTILMFYFIKTPSVNVFDDPWISNIITWCIWVTFYFLINFKSNFSSETVEGDILKLSWDYNEIFLNIFLRDIFYHKYSCK